MEQESQERKIEYQVLWSADSREDLEAVPEDVAETIIEKVGQRLTQLPHFVGQPLRGTIRKLWKIRFGKYRLVYSINHKYKEVYVLAITNRDIAYRNEAVQHLLRLAIVLHERTKEGGL